MQRLTYHNNYLSALNQVILPHVLCTQGETSSRRLWDLVQAAQLGSSSSDTRTNTKGNHCDGITVTATYCIPT
jgi:hypothetical protein